MPDTRTTRLRPPGAVVVALALPFLAGACGEDEPVEAGASPTAAPLVGTEWQLVETSLGGDTTPVPADIDAVVRFDGEGGWSSHGCNYAGGGVEIEDLRLTFDDEGSSTQMACPDPLMAIDDAIGTVLQDTVDAAADGDGLTLTGAGGDRLRLEVRDGIFPSRTLIPLDEGTRGGGDYRLGYEVGEGGPYASWESRTAPGRPWSFVGTGPPSDPRQPDPLGSISEGGITYVFGIIGAEVARVAFEPPGAEPTDLTLHPLDEAAEWQAFGDLVEPVPGAQVVTYDAAGVELGRSVELTWP